MSRLGASFVEEGELPVVSRTVYHECPPGLRARVDAEVKAGRMGIVEDTTNAELLRRQRNAIEGIRYKRRLRPNRAGIVDTSNDTMIGATALEHEDITLYSSDIHLVDANGIAGGEARYVALTGNQVKEFWKKLPEARRAGRMVFSDAELREVHPGFDDPSWVGGAMEEPYSGGNRVGSDMTPHQELLDQYGHELLEKNKNPFDRDNPPM